jgi:hypothetical protein
MKEYIGQTFANVAVKGHRAAFVVATMALGLAASYTLSEYSLPAFLAVASAALALYCADVAREIAGYVSVVANPTDRRRTREITYELFEKYAGRRVKVAFVFALALAFLAVAAMLLRDQDSYPAIDIPRDFGALGEPTRPVSVRCESPCSVTLAEFGNRPQGVPPRIVRQTAIGDSGRAALLPVTLTQPFRRGSGGSPFITVEIVVASDGATVRRRAQIRLPSATAS